MPGMKGSKAPSGLSLRWRPGKKLSERRKYVSGVMLAAQMQGLARRRQPGQPLPPMRNNQLPALAPKALPSTALGTPLDPCSFPVPVGSTPSQDVPSLLVAANTIQNSSVARAHAPLCIESR